MNKNLVFTATYNEVDNISVFLDIVLKIPNIDVLIVDDNSPDKTGDVIKQYQIKNKNLFLISRKGKEGWIVHTKLDLISLKKKIMKI